MNLHYFITLIILSIGTSGYKEIQYIKYTSEYISKLQIHQHQPSISLKLNKKNTTFSKSLPNAPLAYFLKHFPSIQQGGLTLTQLWGLFP